MESWFKQGLEPLYRTAPVFASSDPREAKQGTTGALTEHDLVWRSGRVDSVLRRASAGHLSFMILRYGAAVSIAPGELGRFLLFQVPLAGAAQIRVGNHTVLADSGRAAILSPTTPLQLDWSEGCEQLLVKVPRQRIEAVCGALIGAELNEPIEFYPEVDLSTALGRAWQHYIALMLSGLTQHERAVPSSWWKAQ